MGDHCTRYPVAGRYYLAENVASIRDCLFRAILKWGPARKTYVDRGSVYRWEQLAYSLDRIHSKLVYSRAYYSQGRGVIEKWWQVIKLTNYTTSPFLWNSSITDAWEIGGCPRSLGFFFR